MRVTRLHRSLRQCRQSRYVMTYDSLQYGTKESLPSCMAGRVTPLSQSRLHACFPASLFVFGNNTNRVRTSIAQCTDNYLDSKRVFAKTNFQLSGHKSQRAAPCHHTCFIVAGRQGKETTQEIALRRTDAAIRQVWPGGRCRRQRPNRRQVDPPLSITSAPRLASPQRSLPLPCHQRRSSDPLRKSTVN